MYSIKNLERKCLQVLFTHLIKTVAHRSQLGRKFIGRIDDRVEHLLCQSNQIFAILFDVFVWLESGCVHFETSIWIV